jgi:hypothetical protein
MCRDNGGPLYPPKSFLSAMRRQATAGPNMMDGPPYQKELVQRPIHQETTVRRRSQESRKTGETPAPGGRSDRSEPLL